MRNKQYCTILLLKNFTISDQHLISPYNISIWWNIQIRRITEIMYIDGAVFDRVSCSGFQLTVESNFAFALVLHYYALWLVKKTRATFSTNGNPNQNQSCFRRTRFPALGASYMYLLRILIGSLCCLRLLWLARVITLVLVLRHSIGTALKHKPK